jgi:arylsulfatase A-like enzyme
MPHACRQLCLIIIAAVITGPAGASAEKPNILFIVGDDMGYADVGFHGCSDIPTPHLDALAESGVRFTNGYVTGPYCSPTRAGLLTGRYQQRFGHEFNPGVNKAGLPLSEKTIADHLKALGYRTALVGKWHLGNDDAMHPQQRGFDEFFGFLGGAHSFFDKRGIMRGTQPVEDMDYTTDAFGREAVDFIGRAKPDEPWFLYLSFNAVHTPMDATKDRLEKFEAVEDKTRRTYAAMMSAMDDAIGTVLKKLDETGQRNSTLVAFISDNGGPTMRGVTVNGADNSPLRGSKRTTLEGGIRVPYVLSWIGKIEPKVVDHPVIQLDLTATALNLAGATDEVKSRLDGVDLLPHVSGDKSDAPHKALFWRFGQQMAVRAGDFKLVKYDLNADNNSGDSRQVSALKLYNLATDIHEETDLVSDMPDKVRELQGLWDEWNSTNIDPLWGSGQSATREKNAGKGQKKGGRKNKAREKAD